MPSPGKIEWVPVTCMCRPPLNAYNVCWAYRVPGGVVLVKGDDHDWTSGRFTHWIPASLRHTAFCEWVYDPAEKPEPPQGLS